MHKLNRLFRILHVSRVVCHSILSRPKFSHFKEAPNFYLSIILC